MSAEQREPATDALHIQIWNHEGELVVDRTDPVGDTLIEASIPLRARNDDASRSYRVSGELFSDELLQTTWEVRGTYLAETSAIDVKLTTQCDRPCPWGTTCEQGVCVAGCFEPGPLADEATEAPGACNDLRRGPPAQDLVYFNCEQFYELGPAERGAAVMPETCGDTCVRRCVENCAARSIVPAVGGGACDILGALNVWPLIEDFDGPFSVALWFHSFGEILDETTLLSMPLGTRGASSFRIAVQSRCDRVAPNVFHRISFDTASAVDEPNDVLCTPIPDHALNWNHIVGTWDGAEKVLYINGEPVARKFAEVSFDGSPMVVGHQYVDGELASPVTPAALDEIRLYRGALEHDQVRALFEERVTR